MHAFKNSERGMSIMELMIVTVIIGITAALAAPQFYDHMTRLETKSQVRELTSRLREARSYAVSRKEPCGVCVDGYGSWTVFMDCDSPANNQFDYGTDSSFATGTLSDRVDVSVNSFSQGTVVFSPDGSASESGVVCMVSEDAVVGYTIDVLASTGRVKVTEGAMSSQADSPNN